MAKKIILVVTAMVTGLEDRDDENVFVDCVRAAMTDPVAGGEFWAEALAGSDLVGCEVHNVTVDRGPVRMV